MKVVMVDDSSGDRSLYRLLLEDMVGPQFDFWGVGRGAEGVEICREIVPDCVLLDYRLPDMSGLEFLARLRGGMGEIPACAVVMLTGLADEQIAVSAMKAGAQDYLVKDRITPEGLMSAIQRATEKVGLLRALRDRNERMAESLAEKEVLLKEVHHRVKNNLQVIASLLRLQANSIPDPALGKALRESQHRVESMALVHEQLYDTKDLSYINLPRHVEALAANLFRVYGDPARIAWTAAIDPVELTVDRAIPVSLILNELISNAMKYAFPENRSGSVRIEGGRRNGQIVLAVADDGVGMPADVDPRNSKSLGLEIVRILTKQLKGSLEIERENGTAVRITFPEHGN
jgi:two-component sensor histidine kinase/CheY-like chemotaxis protein